VEEGKKMSNPVWKKVKEVEPGLYLYGGSADKPRFIKSLVCCHTEKEDLRYFVWLARIGEVPPEPVMPPPDLKDGDRVLVRDREESPWYKRNFAGWNHDGRIQTWVCGTRWSGEGTTSWNFYSLPPG
jgi:hypothetical protein